MCINKSQRGISLIELILFIIIVSIALTGLLMVMNMTTKSSVDPLLRKQALAIAESLLEEIELQDFSNPVGGFTGAATQANRALFDDIMDYNGFTTIGIYPADGSATVITGLSNYKVNVDIANAGTDFGIATNTDALKITVTVKDLNDQLIVDTVGYRFNY